MAAAKSNDMNELVESIRAEYLRYKALAEAALRQVTDDELSAPVPNGGNSFAIICWHLSGNLRSRFTDFLTSDGEKPWRNREKEFDERTVSRAEFMTKWDEGWAVLLSALDRPHRRSPAHLCHDSWPVAKGARGAPSLALARGVSRQIGRAH